MAMDKVKKLIESLKHSDITEFKLEKGKSRIAFRREPRPVRHAVPKSAAGTEDDVRETRVEIKSTMVGTFYAAASERRPPLIVEGDHVTPGQKLGMIEAMKIMKDVISTTRGKVEKILITNGHPVEYGQPLFVIDTAIPESGS